MLGDDIPAAHHMNRRFDPLIFGALGICLLIVVPCCVQRSDGSDSAEQAAASASFRLSNLKRPTSAGRVRFVAAGANLQDALDAAQTGDVLVLQAGASFTGPFTLRKKSGQGWIVIQSSALQQLPRAGTRVGPSHSRLMPVLEAISSAGLRTTSLLTLGAVAVPISLLVALLSYAIVESPFLRLRRQWSRSSADVERDPTGGLERETGGGPRIEGSPAVRVRDA